MKVTGERAARARETMNKDLQTRPPGIPADVWQAFTIHRLQEREQIIADERRAQ